MSTNKQALELLIANGQLVADTLRHLAENEIDSDYFAIVSTCEAYGTEIECELVITDYARQAAVTVDELTQALEAAERRIAELSESHGKLHEGMAAIYNAICENGASTSLSAILTFVKRAFEESKAATGITVKGDSE